MKKTWKNFLLLASVFIVSALVLAACGQKPEAEAEPNDGEKAADEVASDTNLLTEIQDRGKLVVGLMGTYPPYNFLNEANEIDGYDADIAKEIAKRIGVEAEFVSTEWAGMIGGLESKKFDVVISQMTITDERKATMDFSQPYIKNTVNIIVSEDNETVQALEDFVGKKIGVALGTNDEAYLRDTLIPEIGDFEIVTYNDVITTLMDLNSGRVDATINNKFALKPLIEKNNLKIKAVGEPVKSDVAGVAMRKGNPELQAAIDAALTEMIEDGTLSDIHVKWFDEEPDF